MIGAKNTTVLTMGTPKMDSYFWGREAPIRIDSASTITSSNRVGKSGYFNQQLGRCT